jgi:hypothetical protein
MLSSSGERIDPPVLPIPFLSLTQMFTEPAASDELRLDYMQQPGEIQLLNNPSPHILSNDYSCLQALISLCCPPPPPLPYPPQMFNELAAPDELQLDYMLQSGEIQLLVQKTNPNFTYCPLNN